LGPEFVLLEGSKSQLKNANIIVIGTYHRELGSKTEDLNAQCCRLGYQSFIDEHSQSGDIVLYEGKPLNVRDLNPSREIIDSSGPIPMVTRFNKNLILVGWENPVLSLIAQMLQLMKEKELQKIKSQMKTAGQEDKELQRLELALLRFSYFERYVILELRNQELMKELARMKQQLRNSRRIFILLGGGHLTDPKLVNLIRYLDENSVQLQSTETLKVFEKSQMTPFEGLHFFRTLLEKMGTSSLEFENIYQDLKTTLYEEGGLSSQQYDRFSQRILFGSSNSNCDKSLDP